LRAPRANHVFDTDEKRIRIENMVIDKSKGGSDLSLSKFDCGSSLHPPWSVDVGHYAPHAT